MLDIKKRSESVQAVVGLLSTLQRLLESQDYPVVTSRDPRLSIENY